MLANISQYLDDKKSPLLTWITIDWTESIRFIRF